MQETARWCKWLREVMYESYLRAFARATLLAAAGWPTCAEPMFFSERYYIKVILRKCKPVEDEILNLT